MLTIYHWEPNANSGKPIMAAYEKGVEFESRYVDLLGFEQHEPGYLKVNPNGTIPSMVHQGQLVAESTVMMEYIDTAFDGPPLRPQDPFERWRMRWWCRFFDQFVGPSISMFGWSFFVGPAVRERDPEELKARVERIPLKERRVALSKAIYGTFSPEEMAESGRRIAFGVAQVESALSERTWIAGGSYLEYLEDAFPDKPLRPSGALGHARILAWARFINEVFMPGANTLGCHAYLAPMLKGRSLPSIDLVPMKFVADAWRMALTNGYSSDLLEDSRRKVSLAVRRIEDALTNSQWIVGPTYSLADIDAFAICNSLPTLTPDIVSSAATPRLFDWLNRIRSRPAVRAALEASRTGKPEAAFAPGPEHSRWG